MSGFGVFKVFAVLGYHLRSCSFRGFKLVRFLRDMVIGITGFFDFLNLEFDGFRGERAVSF